LARRSRGLGDVYKRQDLETGVYYDSATELANLLGMNRVTLIGRLNGNRHELKRYKYA
jgi:hypothetical protein